MVGVAGNAGDELGISRLHRAGGAAQRHDGAGAAERHMIEPARREAEMLGQADGCVGPDREARYRQAVEILWRQAGLLGQRVQRAADPPVRRVGGIAAIRDGHGRADRYVVIGSAGAGDVTHAARRPAHSMRTSARKRLAGSPAKCRHDDRDRNPCAR